MDPNDKMMPFIVFWLFVQRSGGKKAMVQITAKNKRIKIFDEKRTLKLKVNYFPEVITVKIKQKSKIIYAFLYT